MENVISVKSCTTEVLCWGAQRTGTGGLEDLHQVVQILATEPWIIVSASSVQHRGCYRTVSQREK